MRKIFPNYPPGFKAGRFFLTGSNQVLIGSHVVQFLAGRVAYLVQTPFTAQELATLVPSSKTIEE
jgi:predicted AAA+ superfamily ATPase